jgi:hypothetical protein
MDRLTKDIQLRILRDAFFADFASVCLANEKEIPKSLDVPRIPRPEVYVPVRKTPQVPFDPVPRGIREGLDTVSAAEVASLVSKTFNRLAQDDALWEAPLSALQKAFEAGDHPNTLSREDSVLAGGLSEYFDTLDFDVILETVIKNGQYVDPRHTEAWPELTAFDKYGKLLAHIKVMSLDFLKACAKDADEFANVFTYGPGSYAQSIYNDPPDHYLVYGEKEPPENWWEEVFTDPVIQRILWNTYSHRMKQGATTINFWEILIAGPEFLRQDSNFSEVMLDNAIEELVEQGYLKTNYPP